jgi:hypothetical protein
VGETDWVPEVPVILKPLGAVAEQEVALVELQVRVELLPEVMVVGLAASVAVGAETEPTVTVAVAWAVPPAPVQLSV